MTVTLRPQVGLMLSIGEPPDAGRNYPRKLGHFRPKPGLEHQYVDAAERFGEVYGAKPTRLDIALLSNDMADVLDIRLKAWGTDGLRAIGVTNHALAPEHMLDYTDDLRVFPKNKPGSQTVTLAGPDDPLVGRVELKLYCTFRFALPRVTGLTTLAEITTTSKRSMLNLHAGIAQVLALTRGHITGIPFELAVRPTRSRYFDEAEQKRRTAKFWELVFMTPYTIEEFYEQVSLMRGRMLGNGGERLELPAVEHADPYRDAELAPGLWRDDVEQDAADALGDLGTVDDEPPFDLEDESSAPVDGETVATDDALGKSRDTGPAPTPTEAAPEDAFPIPERAQRELEGTGDA